MCIPLTNKLTNYLYGAEHYSRDSWLLEHFMVSQRLMEPEGSIPNSQELSTCPYPEPDQSVHITPSHLYKIQPTHLRLGLPSGLLPPGFPTNKLYASLFFPPLCYKPLPSHPPRLHYSNYTWRRLQIMKLFVMQFSPFSCRLIANLKDPS
jgi:hypothetical protein